MSDLRPQLLDILQHSLGLDRHGFYKGSRDGYRNHFAADLDGENYRFCIDLVELGFMKQLKRVSWSPYVPFVVTDLGREAVREHSPPLPKLSRSQKRYRAFLRSDSGLSFREWLAHEGASHG